MNIRDTWPLIKQAVKEWSDDYAPSMGAALAYYTMFSIAPLLLIIIAVAGLFFGDDAVRGEVFSQVAGLMGEDGARAIEGLLASVSKPEEGIVATVIGVFVLLLGATTVFNELQTDLDRIWRVPAREQSGGLWSMLRSRLLSFGMILAFAFLLMVSLVASAAISALGTWWAPWFGDWEVLAQAVNFAVSFGLITVIFALIYRLMPRATIEWHDVWIGALVTAFLFTLGKFLIGLYLGKSSVALGFGAAGSLVVVMVWVYYSAQIFLLGAEFTWVYAHRYGSRRAADAAATTGPHKADDSDAQRAQPARPAPVVAVSRAALPQAAPRPVSPRVGPHVPATSRAWKTLGSAAIAGLVLGAFARRRRSLHAVETPNR